MFFLYMWQQNDVQSSVQNPGSVLQAAPTGPHLSRRSSSQKTDPGDCATGSWRAPFRSAGYLRDSGAQVEGTDATDRLAQQPKPKRHPNSLDYAEAETEHNP